MVDLGTLKAEIDAIGGQIKQAKADKADKTIVEPLVMQLLAKKQDYADNNNGIGVDGKPFGSAATATDKTNKDPNAAEASSTMTAENAARKAAKKAEKAAKKAAHKSGGGDPPAPPAAAAAAASVKAPPVEKGSAAASKTPVAAVPTAPTPNASALSNFQVTPLQLVINPNAPKHGVGSLMDRPYMALAVAVLTNTDVDLQITLAPRAPQAMLGMEQGGGTLVGDVTMARYLYARAAAAAPNKNGPCNVLATSTTTSTVETEALQASWMDYASSMSSTRVMNEEQQRFKGIALTLEHALLRRTYLVGHALSMADLALFAALGWPCALAEKTDVVGKLLSSNYPSAARWVTMLASHPALQKATQLALGDAEEAVFSHEDVLEPLVSGMNALEGATPGNVVTRFPPEPSGYLHVRTNC